MRFGIKALKRNSLSACHFAHGIEAEREAICSSNQALKDFRQVWGQLLLVTGDQGVRHRLMCFSVNLSAYHGEKKVKKQWRLENSSNTTLNESLFKFQLFLTPVR